MSEELSGNIFPIEIHIKVTENYGLLENYLLLYDWVTFLTCRQIMKCSSKHCKTDAFIFQ